MPTNLQIDDRLLERARKAGRFRTKRETVNEALAEFVRKREQHRVTEDFGKIEFDPAFNHKASRRRRPLIVVDREAFKARSSIT
ncbi:MAG: type II toxin-antitoxin system VapB family antitoxin [Opitutaceae bacterium]